MFQSIMALALAATVSHATPAYELSGHPSLGHGAEYVSVDLSRFGHLHNVSADVESADGQDSVTARLHFNAKTHRWDGKVTFARDNERGTWYVVDTQGWNSSGHLVQRGSPEPSFKVR